MTEATNDRGTRDVTESPSGPVSLKAVSLDTGGPYAKADVGAPGRRPEAAKETADVVEPEVATRRVALRFKLVFGVTVAGCVAILGLAALKTKRAELGPSAGRAALVTTAAIAPPSAPTTSPPAEPASSAPAASPALSAPASMPAASETTHAPTEAPPAADATAEKTTSASHATIRLARAGKPLTIDGKLSKASSAVVTCGSHMVSVGTEKPRRVEAPCGSTIVVDVGKTTRAKPDATKPATKAHAAPPKHH